MSFFTTALFVAYPVLIYLGLVYFDARFVGIVLVVAAGLRFMAPRRDGSRRFGGWNLSLGGGIATAFAIGLIVALSNAELVLRFYPVCMNAIMLGFFGYSLVRPPSIVERIARRTNPNLPESAIRYTRQVTWTWCVFFILNGTVALYTTLYASIETWTLYNGLIAYLLIAALLVGERMVRRFVQRHDGALSSERPSRV